MNQQTGIIAWMARNPVAANLLMVIVMVGGLMGGLDITRETFPSFESEYFRITVPYPGSSPEEVEQGIIVRVEEAIQDLVGIDEISSVAQEGAGIVTVRVDVNEGTTKVLNQAKVRVDGIAAFPLDAEEAVIEEVQTMTRAIMVTLYGDLDETGLKELADDVRDELLRLPDITQVDVVGTRAFEVSIELSDQALLEYGLSFDQVVAAIRNNSRDLPGGRVRTERGSITLRSVGQAYNAAEFSAIPLINRPDGTRILLGDVATIRDAFEDQPVLSRMNQRPSISLQIDRVGDQDIIGISRSVNQYVADKQAQLPDGVSITAWGDASKSLRGRMEMLFKSAAQGSLLVIVVLALFLDLRLAFWVMLGVPFSILGSLLAITLFDIPVSINVLSLFAFILVLGILVDDGIVTAESAYAELENENKGTESVVTGVRKVATATIFGALTTMIAFAPTLFLTEGFARSMVHLGPVVILCLLFSLIETKLILPAHLRHIRPRLDNSEKRGVMAAIERVQNTVARAMVSFAEGPYRRTLELAVEYRYVTMSIFLAWLILCLSLIPAGHVRSVFFPNVPSDYINVSLQMPQGTAWQLTHDYGYRLEQAALRLDQRFREHSGKDEPLVTELMVSSTTDTDLRMTLQMIDSSERDVDSVELSNWLRQEVGVLPGIQSLTYDANTGPMNFPVDVELSGGSLEELRIAARMLREALSEFEGVSDINDTFNAGGAELDIRLKPEGAALGLGQVELARQVRQAFFGAEVQRVQRGRHEVRVYVRLPQQIRTSLSSLDNLWIDLPGGAKVPFSVVGEAHPLTGVSAINRFDRKRVVNVRANVDKSRLEPGVVNKLILSEIMPEIRKSIPSITSRFSGEAEAQQETNQVLLLGLTVIMMMIYAALAIPLKSYGQPLLIMSVIPFGIGGAILGHFILSKELSVLSIIGIMGLTGVLVNDSLVLVDYMNQRVNAGHRWIDSVMDAGVRRFRAVVLTSVTTFVGLLPIQLESSIQSEFVKPMATSVAFGVLFATMVTLFLVPTLCFIGRDLRQLFVREEPELST